MLIRKEATALPLTERRLPHVPIRKATALPLTKRRLPHVPIPKERSYSIAPDRKATSRAYSKSYSIAPDKKKATSRAYSKRSYAKNHRPKSKSFKKYYAKHKESMRANRRARYALAEPKPGVKELYLKAIQAHMLQDSEAKYQMSHVGV